MSDTIIVAILGFVGSCIGSLAGIGLIKYRIDQLEKKVEKHNSIVERTFVLEEDVKYLKEDVRKVESREVSGINKKRNNNQINR